jgi:hypothetical protein
VEAPSVGIPVIDYFLGLLAEHGYLVTVCFAFVENIFINRMGRYGHMLFLTLGVSKTEINEFNVFFLNHI